MSPRCLRSYPLQGVLAVRVHVTLNGDSKVGCLSWVAAAVVNETAAGGELGSWARVVRREHAQGERELS